MGISTQTVDTSLSGLIASLLHSPRELIGNPAILSNASGTILIDNRGRTPCHLLKTDALHRRR